MADIKNIVNAFLALREAAEALPLAQGSKLFLTTGQQLVSIGLMPDIPDNFICRGIKNPVQSNGQLNNAQGTAQMTAVCGHCCNDLFTQFAR